MTLRMTVASVAVRVAMLATGTAHGMAAIYDPLDEILGSVGEVSNPIDPPGGALGDGELFTG